MLPIATVVALQTMWASANMSQDCGLQLLIEHLYVFFSDREKYRSPVKVRSVSDRCVNFVSDSKFIDQSINHGLLGSL